MRPRQPKRSATRILVVALFFAFAIGLGLILLQAQRNTPQSAATTPAPAPLFVTAPSPAPQPVPAPAPVLASVSGRVYDKDTDAPVPGTEIHLHLPNPDPMDPYYERAEPLATALTAPDGTYHFENLLAGKYIVVRGTTPGYKPAERDEILTITLAAAEQRHGPDFDLKKGTSCRVRVLAPDGTPVPFAKVVIYQPPLRDQVKTTNEIGELMATGLDPGGRLFFIVTAPGFVKEQFLKKDKEGHDFRLEPEILNEFELYPDIGGTLRCRIVDENEQLVPGMCIYASEPTPLACADDGTCAVNNISDSQGDAFELGWSISSKEETQERVEILNSPINAVVRAGYETDVTFVIRRTPVVFHEPTDESETTGTVHDWSGAPVPNIDINHGSAYTDSEGRFALSTFGLGDSIVVNQFAKGDYGTHLFENFEPGSKDITLVLQEMPHISGHVVDATTNAPLTRFSLNRENIFDPKGRFSLRANRAPQQTLGFLAAGYAVYELRIMNPSSTALQDIVVRLEAAKKITGRVMDEAGAPIVNARVEARGLEVGGVLTDKEGLFEFPCVTNIPIRGLMVDAKDYVHMVKFFEQDQVQELYHEFRLARPGAIHGKLRRRDGLSPESNYIKLKRNDGQEPPTIWYSYKDNATPSATGLFEFRDIPPGDYVATVHLDDDGEEEEFPLTVRRNQTTHITLE